MIKFTKYISVIIVLVALTCITLTPCVLMAETDSHTDVITDLMRDDTFNISDYPCVITDRSLKVIGIAEGKGGSLYVYVYNPSGDRVATKLRMSVTLDKAPDVKDYELTEVSRKGTLSKYCVENYIFVNLGRQRCYDIVAIYRAWDRKYDEPSGNDNEITEVAYKVGKNYTVRDTVDGSVEYICDDLDVIEVTDKYTDHIRYTKGFHLVWDYCDNWFIAFDTDRQIDKLYEADVKFETRSVIETGSIVVKPSYTYDSFEFHEVTVYSDKRVINETTGWFGKKYEWFEIEKVSDFLEKEQLSSTAKENIKNKKWVLRFYNTQYSVSNYGGSTGAYTKNYTELYNETILRLSFETRGQVYNLGVVDNYQSPDNVPANGNKNPIDDLRDWWERVKDWFDNMMSNLKIVFLVIVGLVIITILFPIIAYPIKWIIREIKYNKEKKK